LEQGITKYALFLKFVWGRGCLYFVAGTLQLAQHSLVDVVSGGFMCFVGVTYIIVGRKTAQKLAELRNTSEETLKSKFAQADLERSGTLTQTQFQNMTRSLGVEMNLRETESAFLQLGKDANEELTYEECQNWWNQMYNDDAPSLIV